MTDRAALAAGDGPPSRNGRENRADSHLSLSWARLFDLCRGNPYGQFHGLRFQDGEPVLDAKPRATITVKLGKDDGPTKPLSEIVSDKRAINLRQQLARWRNGTLRRLTVNDGIPDVVEIEPDDQASGLICS